jgi:hypothetical protein
MNTLESNETYIILIVMALILEATRIAGPLTEVLIFLGFIIHEFVRFYFENRPQLKPAYMPITANNLNLRKERELKND